jgi:hypothetical protein
MLNGRRRSQKNDKKGSGVKIGQIVSASIRSAKPLFKRIASHLFCSKKRPVCISSAVPVHGNKNICRARLSNKNH